MGYEKHIFDKAEEELNQRRMSAENEFKRKNSEIEQKCPEVIEINKQLARTSIELSKLIVKGNSESFNENFNKIKENNIQAQQMIKNLLNLYGYPEDYLYVKYKCPICNDRGYLPSGERCSCFYELLNKYSAQELNKSANMPLCDFGHFSLKYYEEKFEQNGLDCYRKMSDNLHFCKKYAECFSQSSESLFLIGKTGVGKTHLSLSIAKVVIEKGFTVAYGSVLNYLRFIEKEHFGRSESNNKDTLQTLINIDLLVLDDLGSEFQTGFYESVLYNIINSRLNMGLPTIISSNLSTNELQSRYNDRIISRIFGLYNIILCVGQDIRQIKRLSGENY